MKVIQTLNEYFIADADEEIPVSDFIWFYGVIIGMIIIMMVVFILG